ncbi:hypothetical protein F8M41_001832 [Gigaspora margarita]|uniref:Uncharacterized protein n=1 Tax=Gigaspora margarita TaxID=4874 RepID=A0A8H4AYY4_GIGMA|nr:hypothetical protein F8M41_001832 [Gigaspora margarita]
MKAYLKSMLKEVWAMNSNEEAVRNCIGEKKNLLKNLISKKITLENSKNVLNSGVNFFVYLKRQWARDLLNSWCFSRQIQAAIALGIPLEKIPTTNNISE